MLTNILVNELFNKHVTVVAIITDMILMCIASNVVLMTFAVLFEIVRHCRRRRVIQRCSSLLINVLPGWLSRVLGSFLLLDPPKYGKRRRQECHGKHTKISS